MIDTRIVEYGPNLRLLAGTDARPTAQLVVRRNRN